MALLIVYNESKAAYSTLVAIVWYSMVLSPPLLSIYNAVVVGGCDLQIQSLHSCTRTLYCTGWRVWYTDTVPPQLYTLLYWVEGSTQCWHYGRWEKGGQLARVSPLFMLLIGKDVSGLLFWHEWSALQSVAVRRSTGNDVSGHYFRRYLFIHFFLFFSFSRRQLFS